MLNIPRHHKERNDHRVYGSQAVEVESRGSSRKRIGVIKDISPAGARILIHDAASLAANIRLSSPSIGESVEATIRWRRKTEIGIRFASPLT